VERETLEIPAGKLDCAGEEGLLCATRELEEETGYKSDDIEWLLTMRTTIGFCNEKIEIYVAKNLKVSKQNLDENEYVDVKPYTVSELKELIYSGKIEDSKTISAILAYDVKYNHK
jgi:ADP-ribose pyrophosphatase